MRKLKEPLTITIETEEELFGLWHRLNARPELFMSYGEDSYDYEGWLAKEGKALYKFDAVMFEGEGSTDRLFDVVHSGLEKRYKLDEEEGLYEERELDEEDEYVKFDTFDDFYNWAVEGWHSYAKFIDATGVDWSDLEGVEFQVIHNRVYFREDIDTNVDRGLEQRRGMTEKE